MVSAPDYLLLDANMEVISRCELVRSYAGMVAEHQKDPEVVALITGLAFDMASLAKEQVSGIAALTVFSLSRQCVETSPNRDLLIAEYVTAVREKLTDKFRAGVRNDKSKYSPRATEIELLLQCAEFEQESQAWCLTLVNWIEANPKTVHRRSLEKIPLLRSTCENFVGNYIVFSAGITGVTEKVINHSQSSKEVEKDSIQVPGLSLKSKIVVVGLIVFVLYFLLTELF